MSNISSTQRPYNVLWQQICTPYWYNYSTCSYKKRCACPHSWNRLFMLTSFLLMLWFYNRPSEIFIRVSIRQASAWSVTVILALRSSTGTILVIRVSYIHTESNCKVYHDDATIRIHLNHHPVDTYHSTKKASNHHANLTLEMYSFTL